MVVDVKLGTWGHLGSINTVAGRRVPPPSTPTNRIGLMRGRTSSPLKLVPVETRFGIMKPAPGAHRRPTPGYL